jgi:molecular chaperone DnaK
MVKEAEANADTDKKRREMVESKNHAEAMVHQVERNLKDHGDKMPAADRSEAESAITAVRTAMEGTNPDELKAASDRLSQAAMKIGEHVYKAEQAGAGPQAEGASPEAENVVDAEFEELDENKKKSA